MKHYIVVKFIESFDYKNRIPEITDIFNRTLEINGINAVCVKPSNSCRENRYDLMIEIDMEKSALSSYDSSAPHREWKETFGGYISHKAIFDCD